MTRSISRQLSEKDIKEFKDIYEKDYKVSLSFDEAKEKAECFLAFMRTMMR